MDYNNIEETQELIYACWVNSIPGFGRGRCYRLHELCGSMQEAYNMEKKDITTLFGEKAGNNWECYKKCHKPESLYEQYVNKGIRYTWYMADDYPYKLQNIPDPPFGIYYIGQLPDHRCPSVAMIGARRYSDYGRYMAEYFADRFGRAGINVISGMAMGIDGISQRAALKAGGCSYGVLGCGVDIVYPDSNRDLYEHLIEQGCVLSEYPPSTEPKAGLFPQRNRIISALSDVVLVIEARQKSGTLITVDMALEQGRDVYVIPGRCTDNLSLGCNKLIRQGAAVATSPEDIMEDMGWIHTPEKQQDMKGEQEKKNIQLSLVSTDILAVLDVIPCTLDDMMSALTQRKTGYTIPQICQAVLELELSGLVIRSGGQYRRTYLEQ